MANLSQEARNALDALNRQIEASTKKLARMPASRRTDCFVEFTKEMTPVTSGHRAELRLSSDDSETPQICVCSYGERGRFIESVPISDFRVTERVAIAKLIPDLLRAAKFSEGKILEDALQAANDIEQTLNDIE